jgi:hypothetical protein
MAEPKDKSFVVTAYQRSLKATRLRGPVVSERTPNEKEALQRQIATTCAQINEVACKLYGLTDEEIKIVEGATGKS